jgi:acyl-coenzyme A synthetase/AMP-(fatty) acid ligase
MPASQRLTSHPIPHPTFVAALSIGLIVVPYNAWLTSSELLFCINDSGCSLLFVDPEREQRLEGVKEELRKKGLRNVVLCRSGAEEDRGKERGWCDAEWEEVLEGGKREMPEERVEPEGKRTKRSFLSILINSPDSPLSNFDQSNFLSNGLL